MASLQQRLTGLIDAIFADTGKASNLSSTITATTLVGAINEVKVVADAAAGGGIAINDSLTTLTDAWSSTKIAAELAVTLAAAQTNTTAQIATALEGEDLSELADAIAANAAADVNLATAASVATLSATVANKANTADIYTRTELGDPDTDLAAYWNSL